MSLLCAVTFIVCNHVWSKRFFQNSNLKLKSRFITWSFIFPTVSQLTHLQQDLLSHVCIQVKQPVSYKVVGELIT